MELFFYGDPPTIGRSCSSGGGLQLSCHVGLTVYVKRHFCIGPHVQFTTTVDARCARSRHSRPCSLSDLS